MDNSNTFTALDYIDRGVARASDNDFEGAKTDFEYAVKLAPESVEAYSNLGSALQALNLHQDAILIYNEGLLIDPKHLVSLYCRAVSFSFLGEWEASRDDYSSAISLHHDFARAFMGRGYVWKRMGENELARADFDQFFALAGPEDAALIPQVKEWREEINSVNQLSEEKSIDNLFDQAYQEAQAGNGMAAISLYSEILSQNPISVEAFANRANVYAATHDYRLALIDIRQAIELDDSIPILYFNRGNIYQDLGQYELAIGDYEEALKRDPEIAGAWFQLGKYKEKQGQNSGLDDFEKALEIDPYYSDALVERSKLRINSKEYSLAINDLVLAVDIDPDNPEIYDLVESIIVVYDLEILNKPNDPFAYVARGQIFQRIGRDQDALADWNFAVKLAPENPLLIHGRANLYLDTEQMGHALDDFDRAIELDPSNMDFFLDRASVFIAVGRPDDALDDINHAISMDDSKSSYYLFRGILRRMRAFYEIAEEDFSKAIELGENNSVVFYERAMAKLGKSNLEGAAQDFEASLEREENPETRYDCGLTYIHLGYFDEALDHLSQAIELIPDYADALTERGWIFMMKDRDKEALTDFNQAITLQPEAFWAWAYRAELFYKNETWSEAVMDASRALLRDSEWTMGYKIKGMSYFQMNKYREALIDLDKYVSRNSEIGEEEEVEIKAIISKLRSSF